MRVAAVDSQSYGGMGGTADARAGGGGGETRIKEVVQ